MNNKQRLAVYKEKVNDTIQKMMYELFKQQPDHYIEWMIQYLQSQKPGKQVRESLMVEYNLSSEEDQVDEIEELPIPISKSKPQRSSVSAEVFGMYNKKEHFQPRVIPKKEEQKQHILEKLKKVFMFHALDSHELNIVMDAMEEKQFQKGDWIIKQGDDGDELYVVDVGQLDCYRRMQPSDTEPKMIKQYNAGDLFGELALLYNAPRAASIQAKSGAILFALDRSTFNNIVKDATIKKREQFEEVLSKIEILKSMDAYEKTQICDGLKEQHFQAGEFIIKEGDEGNKFYIVFKGNLVAYKENNGQQEEVQKYQPGDYFGELALLHKVPRQATIKAETDCTVAYLDYNSFMRLLGPIENILIRNAENYKKFISD